MDSEIRHLTLSQLAYAYRQRELSPVEVTQSYLDAIAAQDDPENRIYMQLLHERALSQAKRAAQDFQHGIDRSPIQGIPLAIKDLIDLKGTVTTAGTRVFNRRALADAPIAARLDQAGAVFLGKTNLTEIAFSGLGINPHYGTPSSALAEGCIPGGSSSGSGVAVARGLAAGALGSDTGGSVRIPSAFNGLVGLKTTNGDITTEAVALLSFTLDTLGPMARTVEDCFTLWQAMRGDTPSRLQAQGLKGAVLLVPEQLLEGLERPVAVAFEAVCAELRALGAEVITQIDATLTDIQVLYAQHGYPAGFESLMLYQDVLVEHMGQWDIRVVKRVEQNKARPSTDYAALMYAMKIVPPRFWQGLKERGIDAVIAPTVPILPPKITSLEEEDAYYQANGLCLRNTSPFNFLQGPAVSMPINPEKPIGLMIATPPYQEKRALALARSLEMALAHTAHTRNT